VFYFIFFFILLLCDPVFLTVGHDGFFTNIAPLFDRKNYALWGISMRTYVMALGFDIWKSIPISSISPTNPPIDTTRKKASEKDAKAMNTILC
jgi:hypothetical protein